MKKTILLTGSSGFVGRNLLRIVASSGSTAERTQWVCVDAIDAEPPLIVPNGTKLLQANLDNWAEVQALLAHVNPTHIIHLAGALGKAHTPDAYERLFRSNLLSTCHLLEGLRGIQSKSDKPSLKPHFIVISTGLVYGPQSCPFHEWMPALPPDMYSLTKMLAEEAVLAFERMGIIDACILRPAILYGPGQKGDMFVPSLVNAISTGRRFAMTHGEQTRDFVHIDDMVAAVLLANESRLLGKFNIGTGTSISMRQVGEMAATLAGQPELLGLGDVPYRTREVWDYALDAGRLRGIGWLPGADLQSGLLGCLGLHEAAG